MTVQNPPGFLQNAGATHTAEQFRNWLNVLSAGRVSTTSLISRGGVNPTLGNALQVTQTGSPSMAVIVKSGGAVIPGSEGSKQGSYSVLNDADVTLSISAAHATLNRIDSVIFKVEDSAYSGVANTSSVVVVTGTPASSPAAPVLPNNCIELARVSILALDTSITNGEITDRRPYMAATGGTIICTSTARPAANTVSDGQRIYELDTDRSYITHDAGTTWTNSTELYLARTTTSGTVPSVSFTGIPSALRSLEVFWTIRGDDGATQNFLRMRVNNISSGSYTSEQITGNGATTGSSLIDASGTEAFIGYAACAGATAGIYGSGKVTFQGWDSPHSGFLGWTFNSQSMTAGGLAIAGGGSVSPAGPYNRLDFFISPGNMIIGSDIQLVGYRT